MSPDHAGPAAFAELISELCARPDLWAPDPGREDRISAIDEPAGDSGAGVAQARALQAALHEAGYGWLSGPRKYGGQGRTVAEEQELERRLAEGGLPSRAPLFVGLRIVAPAVLVHGSEALRQTILPGLFSGKVIGCQLFSEPGAGSDLASVTTRAVRDGDDWVVTGQKVWTSLAHVADIGEALVRTDPAAAKHAGLSMLLIDMTAPGVTVRPLRQSTGRAAFNEVFLDEVRVPDSNRIGAEGTGWAVAGTSLASERGSMATGEGPLSANIRERFAALLHRELGTDPLSRQHTARAITAVVAALAALNRNDDWEFGLTPVAPSIQKLLMVRAVDEIARAAEEVLGNRAHIDNGEEDTFCWSEFALSANGIHIAGGTDEIQRTLVAQRGLGLPRPQRVRG